MSVVGRNVFPNPSFESELGVPVGASRSSVWAVEGSFSLFVPSVFGYGHGSYGHGSYGHGPV